MKNVKPLEEKYIIRARQWERNGCHSNNCYNSLGNERMFKQSHLRNKLFK